MSMGSEEAVLQALQCACSQDPSVLKAGEQQLDAWKTQKGFYSVLAGVFSSRSLEPTVRWMAITYIKNGVERHWRPGAPDPIPPEEKAVVRGALLRCLEEPVRQVATQQAVLVARIARLDVPEEWPELLPALTEGVRSSSELVRQCHLLTLQHVVKALAGRRLANHRRMFCDLTTGLFVYVVELWGTHLQGGVALVSAGNAESAVSTLEMARVCLKILRQMIVHGFLKFYTILEALQFMRSLLDQVPALYQLRSQLSAGSGVVAVLEDNILLMMKILKEVQSHHAIGYSSFITASLELVSRLVFATETDGQQFESFVISALNLFSQILLCEDYHLPEPGYLTQSSPPPQVLEAHQAKLTFFKAATCQYLLERLVGHFMLLSEEELQMWEAEPEEFAQEKAGETYQHSFRACVEHSLVCLLHEFQQTVAPFLLAMIHAVQAADASADVQTLRQKEAVYKAAGLGAYDLYEEVDYDSWFQTQLLRELTVKDPRYKIVRHRVVWLLGNWATVKMSPSLLPSLYAVLVPMLQPCEDLAVRLTAAESLKMVVDDFNFAVEDLSSVLSDAMSLLFQLLLDVKKCETKMVVLNTFSLLMDRVGVAIQPHIAPVLQYMPQLWTESAGDHTSSMLRCIILSTLNNIMKGLGGMSSALHSFILPVIQLATDAKTPEHVYLAEDGLDLWLTTIRYAPALSPDLLQLLGNMVGLLGLNPPSDDSTASMSGLMDIGSDSLLICFKIIDAYIVLCASEPQQFIQACGEIVVRSCQAYLCDVKPEGVVAIVGVVTRMAHLFPAHFPQLVQPLLLTVLRNLLQEEDYPPTTSAYLSLLARVLVQSASFFFPFLEQVAPQTQKSAGELFGLIIDHWSEKLDHMSNVKHRKLTGLAVASLLPLADQCVTSRFPVLLNMCVEVLHDVMDTTDDNVLFDVLVAGDAADSGSPRETAETEHDKREKQLAGFDPLRTVALHSHVSAKLEECALVHGEQSYTALMQAVDVAVREQLVEFLPHSMAASLLALSA